MSCNVRRLHSKMCCACASRTRSDKISNNTRACIVCSQPATATCFFNSCGSGNPRLEGLQEYVFSSYVCMNIFLRIFSPRIKQAPLMEVNDSFQDNCPKIRVMLERLMPKCIKELNSGNKSGTKNSFCT